MATAQTQVKGVVVDETGEPVIGATILIKGTSQGTITDFDGNFALTTQPGATLVVSYVGMNTQEVAAGPNMRIVMVSDAEILDEVLVVAYGTAKKSTFTGSASAVSSESITSARVESVDKALNGKVSGVRVTSLTGDPGSSGHIQIRGIGSITGSTSPLYVIDGIPMTTGDYGSRVSSNTLSSLNPEDVESMTVLKDAAAASLYGSRAANGVVIITTKKGKSGKTKFNLNMNTGFSNMATNSYEMMSGTEYANYHKAALEGYHLRYSGLGMDPSQPNYGDAAKIAAAKQFAEDTYLDLDWSNVTEVKDGDNWRDLIYDGGNQSEVQFSASGGSEKTNFFASLGYNKVKGLVKYREFERYTSMLNISNKAANWLEINFKNQMAYSNQTGRGDQTDQEQGISTASPLSMMMGSIPTEKAYNEDGSYNMNSNMNGNVANALWALSPNESSVSNKTYRFMNNVGAKVIFSDNLSFNTNNSVDYFTVKSFNYWSPVSIDGASLKGLGEKQEEEVMSLTTSNVLNYTNSFNDVHNFDALLGAEAQKYNNNWHFLAATDYSNSILQELANGQPHNATSGFVNNFMMSYFGNLNYNYADKYYIAGSLRSDESSKLGLNKRRGTFYSASGSWRFSQEEFLKNDFLTDGKIRFSYGTNGNLPGGSYSYMGLYYFGGNYGDKPASYLDQLENKDLGWEKSKNMNIGIDFTLAHRFTFGVEYFNKYTSDLLLAAPISYSTGASSITMNLGEISNKGFEFEFHGSDLLMSNFKWNSDFTLTTLKSVVEKLPDGDIIAGDGGLYIYREKEDLYSFYLPTYLGVDPDNGLAMFAKDPNKPDSEDNRTYTYAQAGKKVQGSAFPKVNGGFSNSFSYKGVSLNVLLTYQFGGNLFDYPGYFQKHDGLRMFNFNLLKEVAGDYWQKPGDVVNNPRPILSNPYRSDRWSTRHILSTDFIRLKEISLGYSLPKTWYNKLGVSNVDLSINVNNLAYLYAATDNMELEVALNGYRTVDTPMARTFSFGINVGF